MKTLNEKIIDQFGICVRCQQIASPPYQDHSVVINTCLVDDGSKRVYAYDLCENCIEDLKEWIEEGDAKSQQEKVLRKESKKQF